jgi:uncharacterized DUF497 family protein
MDTRFVLQGSTFIWDEQKARENPRRHDGITFEQAAEAFFDPFLKIVDASRNEEAHDAIIGMDARWNLLFVVHIELEEDAIRLISARKSPRQERDDYEV